MKAIAALALLALTLPLIAADAPANEEAAVRAAIEHYFRAHATGDGKHLLQAFRPELHMMFVREGALQMKTRDEFIAGFSGKPADDEAQRKRTIEMIDAFFREQSEPTINPLQIRPVHQTRPDVVGFANAIPHLHKLYQWESKLCPTPKENRDA